jgi:hypothetical protein
MKHITRISVWITVVAILVVASSLVAFAAGTFRSPTKDMFCIAGSACASGYGITPAASLVSGSCNTTQIGYVGWDLRTTPPGTGPAGAILSAKLTLTTYNVVNPPAGPMTFSLVIPNSQTWTEATTTDPGTGSVIATGTATLTPGTGAQTVTFGGPGDTVAANALGGYFNGLKSGANPASSTIGVRITGSGCGQTGTIVYFAEHGATGEADLIFYPNNDATAVTLSTFRSADPAVNWPLIAGLGVLAAVVVGGVAVTRKRAAGR